MMRRALMTLILSQNIDRIIDLSQVFSKSRPSIFVRLTSSLQGGSKMTLESKREQQQKESDNGEVGIMTSKDGMTNVLCHWIGSIKSRVDVLNRNCTRINVLTNKMPANVNMAGSTRSSIVVAEIDGASVVTVEDHRMMQIQIKFLNDVFDEEHFT